MGRTFSAAWPDLTLQHFAPREPIYAADLQALAEAANWLHARGMTAVTQAWADNIFSRQSNVYSAGHQAIYRVPDPGGGRVTVSGLVRASNGGAGGRVRLTSSGGASTATSGAITADGWYALGPVTCSFSFGYEDLEVRTIGDGSDPTVVESLFLYFSPATSPLGSGSLGGFYPFDLSELDADRPVSADVLSRFLTNLTNLLARNRVYYTWSGLSDVDDPTAGTEAMPEWVHRGWTRGISGAIADGLTATVYVAANGGASDTYALVAHGGHALAGEPPWRTAIKIPAGVTGWQTATVGVDESTRVEGFDYPLASVGTWPGRPGADAEITSITVWGR